MSLSLRNVSAWILAAIIVGAMLVAGDWAIRVPFFQQPDEAAHADYAFALFDAGSLFTVKHAKPSTNVTRQARYLAQISNYRGLRYNVRGRLPNGYGTLAYFRTMDISAPRISRIIPSSGSSVPYVMFSYPALYYVIIAGIMTATSSLTHGSLIASFFAARFFSVACLGASVFLAYRIFRSIGVATETSLLATAAVAFLPLSSSISSTVQPDNLTALLVNVCFLLLLSYKRNPCGFALPLSIGLTLSGLSFVKEHYALALSGTAIAFACTVARDRPLPKRYASIATIVVLPLLSLILAPRLMPVSTMQFPAWSAADHVSSISETIVTMTSIWFNGFRNIYLGGMGTEGFWMKFGFRAGSTYSGTPKSILLFVLATLSCMTITFLCLREWRVLQSITRIARFRSYKIAARLIFADVLLNTYLATTVILFGVYVLTYGELSLQGRYWYAVLVPTLAISLSIIPRALPRLARKRFAFIVALGWASYASVSVPSALSAREFDFYGNHPGLPTYEIGEIQNVVDERGHRYPTDRIEPGNAHVISLAGYAIDAERGLPARHLFVEIDGKQSTLVRGGIRSYDVYRTFNDPLLLNSGFRANISTRKLSCGTHSGQVLISENRAPRGLRIASFTIVTAPPSCGHHAETLQ